jgi:predicted peptidase
VYIGEVRNYHRAVARFLVLLWVSLCWLTLTGFGYGRPQTGFVDREVTVSGTTYRYQVYVPADFRTKKNWPVILFLHGAGERGDDGMLQSDVGIGHAIRVHRSQFPFVVVMPQCREGKIWGDPEMQALAIAALEASVQEFRGDRHRIYLTGISMGGYGTWDLAALHPGRFAALVPICGGVRPPKDWPQLRSRVIEDPNMSDPYAEIARRIGKTPVWFFHGDADPAVPVEESRSLAAALKALNANYKYTEYPGVGHDSWDRAYAEPGLASWLLSWSLKH